MAAHLMTIDQATQALGISRSTLWRRFRSGNIQSVRRGGRRLVQLPARKPVGALEDLVREQLQAAERFNN